MKGGKAQTLDFKRKREGRTNYRDRLKIIDSGKLRVVVRRSLNNINVQLVLFGEKGDRVLLSSSTRELIKYGWKAHRGNLSSAYLLGFLCGLKAMKNSLKEGVLDVGMARAIKNSAFFAVARGMRDAGFEIPLGENTAPSDDRVYGRHIENYAKSIKSSVVFSRYRKAGLEPKELSKHVVEVKKKITEKWQ